MSSAPTLGCWLCSAEARGLRPRPGPFTPNLLGAGRERSRSASAFPPTHSLAEALQSCRQVGARSPQAPPAQRRPDNEARACLEPYGPSLGLDSRPGLGRPPSWCLCPPFRVLGGVPVPACPSGAPWRSRACGAASRSCLLLCHWEQQPALPRASCWPPPMVSEPGAFRTRVSGTPPDPCAHRTLSPGGSCLFPPWVKHLGARVASGPRRRLRESRVGLLVRSLCPRDLGQAGPRPQGSE